MRHDFFQSPHADCARSNVQKSQHAWTSQRSGHTRFLLRLGSLWLGGWCQATTLSLELKQSLNEVIPAFCPVLLSSASLEDVFHGLFGAHRERDECSNQGRCGAVNASIAVEENLELLFRFRSILLQGFNHSCPDLQKLLLAGAREPKPQAGVQMPYARKVADSRTNAVPATRYVCMNE